MVDQARKPPDVLLRTKDIFVEKLVPIVPRNVARARLLPNTSKGSISSFEDELFARNGEQI